jgi:hypothetical protein
VSTSPSGSAPVARRFPGPEAALWAALALGLALRLALWFHRSGTLWFEEDVPVAWGFRLWGFEQGGFDPNPHSAVWPHLSVYFYFLVQGVQYLAGRLTGLYAGPADFRAAAALDPDLLRAGAMLTSIGVGLAVVWVAARLARRLAGPGAAAWMALALVLDPLHIRYSLVVAPDMLLSLFVLLGILAALDVQARGRLRDSLRGGLWLGLGAACKYSPALLALPLLLAHARRPGGRRGFAVLLDGRLWWTGLAALAAFAATTPYTLLDLSRRWSDFQLGAAVLTTGPFGGERHFAAVDYVRHLLPDDLGWPLYLLLAAALGWALLRPARERTLIVAFLVPYLILFGLVPTPFTRYLLPALPLLLVLGAAAGRVWWGRKGARPWAVVALALALLGLGWRSALFMEHSLRPDSRALAREWFAAQVPDRTVVAAEHLGPRLPSRTDWEVAASAPGVSERWRGRAERGLAYWVMPMPLSFPDPEITADFYDPGLYLGYDLVVTSSAVSGRYLAHPARFPVQADFYRALEEFFEVAYRTPAGRRAGPSIVAYRPPARRDSLEAWRAERARARPAPSRVASLDWLGALFAERAQFFIHAERYEAALEMWRRALLWRGAPADWWYQYGLCSEVVGDWQQACHALRVAYDLDPTRVEAGLSLAEDEGRCGRPEVGRRVLQQVLARGGLTPEQAHWAEQIGEGLGERD